MTTTNIFVLTFLLNLLHTYGQDVVGCGGFVKSDITINYSLVEVKLYTKQGILKYQTDCAPHNGYYLIPLYDKGDYVLKVEPPTGWTFEPSSIDLHVDGKTDPCSKNQDINFIFRGFLISGKVVSNGMKDGPVGVTVSLKPKGSREAQFVTQSVEGGSYRFDVVTPGEYDIEASHKSWKILKSKAKVVLRNDLLQVQEDFVIAGYDVIGRVISNEDPIKGVHFILFSEDVSKQKITSCNSAIPDGFVSSENRKPLCSVVSNSDGSFQFTMLPPGSYKILPFYKGQNIKFDVRPSSLTFKVRHEDVTLKDVFQVQGFSVSGKVRSKVGGSGVVKANVLVTSESDSNILPHSTHTSEGGVFHLENVKAGMYRIVVTFPSGDLIFPPMVVKITPNTPQLPDVIASGFKMCGKLVIRKTNSNKVPELSISVEEKGVPGSATILTVDKSGEFCSVLKAGKYTAKPIAVLPNEPVSLKFDPPQAEIDISDRAKLDLVFTQYLSSISGSVVCIATCPELSVMLKDSSGQLLETASTVKNKFSFKNLLSGNYVLSVVQENWCWKEESVKVQVAHKNVNDVKFVQTGYLMTIWTSHEAQVTYKLHQKNAKSHDKPALIDLIRGTNNHCFKNPGIYDLSVLSCHEFGEENYKYDTSNPVVITFTAMKHQITGTLTADVKTDDIKVTVTPPDGKSYVIPVKPADKKAKNNVYQFMFSAYPNQVIKLTPTSGTLLFYPEESKITALDHCIDNAVSFEGRKGLFINGQVNPPLGNVKVTVVAVDGSRMPIILETKDNGKYDLGPLDSLTKYSVSAEKPGYVLKEIEGKNGHFEAFKLAEIKVSVMDESSQSLPGVLLSLTGGIDFRYNNVTEEDGKMTFSDLSPGQYFMKPMMKEYKFEPVSKMFNVTEGSSVQFTVKAIRTAYSCFGKITSLTGESEQGIAIEAVGIDSLNAKSNPACTQLQEDGMSENDGSFRIRGLKPGCEYKLQLKNSSDTNKHIERSSPKFKIIKIGNEDLKDVKLMVFRHVQQIEVTANIVTDTEFLHMLKVKLYKEDNPDVAINTINIGMSSFFQLPSLPIDNTNYIIRLETSLPRNTYETDENSMPEVYFQANTSYRHITIHFKPKVRLMDQEALGQGTLLALPFTILVIVLIYNYSKIVPLVTQANATIQGLVNSGRAPESSTVDPVIMKRKIKVRKAL